MRARFWLLAFVVSVLALGSSSSAQLGGRSYERRKVVSNPAAGSQATASIAAAAGVRHVVDCVSFSAAATTAPAAATLLTVNVRDGATGAGTVLYSWQVVALAATGQLVAPHSVCGLNLPGTANTALTVEFSALLANLVESVSFTYYDIPSS